MSTHPSAALPPDPHPGLTGEIAAQIAMNMQSDCLSFEGVNVHFRQGWREACASIAAVLRGRQ